MSEVSRRAFLQVSLAAGGALALGFVLPGCGASFTAKHAEATGELVPNAWLKILPDDRVFFLLDRVEMGQGTMTSHATILAEELDIDPHKIHVQLADADRAYDNPDPEVRFQITGGSSSVKSSFLPLRKAGAAAREMLRAGAAATWQCAVSECSADDGVIKHVSGKTASYGSLTRAAARQGIPGDPPLKQPSQFKWLGKPLRRLDAKMKVDGTGVYGIDVKVEGMLTAVVVRAPTIGGTVRSFDDALVRKEPGVVDVVPICRDGKGPSEPIDRIAIVATSYWRARSAADKLKVEWDEGPLAHASTESIRATHAKRSELDGLEVMNVGDVKGATAKGVKTLRANYEAPYLAHATMEPMNCTAYVEKDRATIWAPTQAPPLARLEARKITGFDLEQITVHTTLLGGGFGRRSFNDFVSDAVHVSRKLQKPVKVVWSREDDMRNDFYRPMTHNVLEGSVDERGEIVSWFHRVVGPSIVSRLAVDWGPGLMPNGMPQALSLMMARTVASLYKADDVAADPTSVQGIGSVDFPYAFPNLRVEHVPYDPGVPVGPWRSVGYSENCFVVESFLDELAHEAKRDPLEVRRALTKGSPRMQRVFELAAEKAGWGKELDKNRSLGIAGAYAFRTYVAQVAEVSVDDGKIHVHKVVCAVDCGFAVNPDLVAAQVESGVVYGLSAALRQEITIENGRVKQGNFHEFEPLRMYEAPKIEVHIVPSDAPPHGVGEIGVPPIAPAVANAVFAATGKRLRKLPLQKALYEATKEGGR